MESAQNQGPRLYFLDNLRTFLILLVICLHAGITYESSGWPAFFWIVDDPDTNDLSGLMNMILDVFIMPGMFFIAGYFTPGSLSRKSERSFLWGKFKRIMLPWLIAVFTLIPAYKMIFLASRGLPQESWTRYFHFSNGVFSQSWLWFLPLLAVFYLLYLLAIRSKLDLSSLSFTQGAGLVFSLGLMQAWAMYLVAWEGWTKIIILDFQNERILLYLMLFFLGALGYQRRIFEQPMKTRVWFHVTNGLLWIPLFAYIAAALYPFLKPGEFLVHPVMDQLLVRLFFYVSLAGLLYSSINLFRVYLNRTSRLMLILNQNAYGVYILHMIVLGLIAMALLGVNMGSKSKYLLVIVSTYLVSNVLVSIYQVGKKRWLAR